MKWWKRFCRHVTFPALFGRSLDPASNCSNGQRFLLLDSRFFFFTSTRIFFCPDSNFKISNRVCCHDICLVFFRSWTYILQISTHVFYCIRCILQVSTYVLRFQHVFTIGMIFVRNGTPYVVMVAKFLDDNQSKTSLKKWICTVSNFIDLIQFDLIYNIRSWIRKDHIGEFCAVISPTPWSGHVKLGSFTSQTCNDS